MGDTDCIFKGVEMIQKIFITKDGRASVTCPKCYKTKLLDVSKYNYLKKEVKLKCRCACKHVFPVILERRKHIRKPVSLDGSVKLGNITHPIKVVDITRSGLQFNTRQVLDFTLQSHIVINFTLNDAGRSKVSREVIIKKINKAEIGVEFLSQDHYDKLGPYLMFHLN